MLTHVVPLLQAADLDASVRFYGEKLGFLTGSTEGGFCVVRRDGCTLYLAQKTKAVDVTNKAARAQPNDGWCNDDLHFFCEPGTLDDLYEEFRLRGVRMPDDYEHGPALRSYGIRDFSIIAPNGYDLVFGEELPGDA